MITDIHVNILESLIPKNGGTTGSYTFRIGIGIIIVIHAVLLPQVLE